MTSYSSYGQTWAPIPFTVGAGTGSFTMCSGLVTATVTDAFEYTDGTVGEVGLSSGIDILGVITFSPAFHIRIEDKTSSGSNNGDTWNIEASSSVSWTPFGSEASSSGVDLDLTLTSTGTRSGGETNSPTSSLTFTKSFLGGGLRIYYDSDICTTLPIKLLNFNAYIKANGLVELKWQTASEINNDFFTIERSLDGVDWEKLKRINGAGNSNSLLNYSSFDENPSLGTSYYRLKQTDFDGQFEYFQIISINIQQLANSQIEIYPNPAINQIIIKGRSNELKEILVYNTLGQNVTSLINQVVTNETQLVIDMSKLNTGMYYVKTKTTANKVYKQ